MRQKILAANWKMNKTSQEALAFLEEFKKLFNFKSSVEIIFAPAFTILESFSRAIKESSLNVCAQNMHWQDSGAFTGEISAPMLTSLGCEYVILGHSERRHLFFETEEMIAQKISQALKHKLKVILCVGEKGEERKQKKTFDVVKTQLLSGLKKVSKQNLISLVIAYEPVWAIGTGNHAMPEQAEEVHRFIRKVIWDATDMDTASQVRILYGGSVAPSNCKGIFEAPNVDGALVGSASLTPKTFIEILKQMA